MKKLDLRESIKIIITVLKSNEIIKAIETSEKAIIKRALISLLLDSKRGFDSTDTIEEYRNIYKQLGVVIYESDLFGRMLEFISTSDTKRNILLLNDSFVEFYIFHKTLITTFNLVDQLMINDKSLFNEKGNFDAEKAEDEGNLILQINDDDDVRLSKIVIILDSCDKLIAAVYEWLNKIESEKLNQVPKISLIDSGTDIGINIKVPSKAANKITEILKELMEFIINYKGYKFKKSNEAIKESLTVLKELNDALQKGIIEQEEYERIKLGIMTNAETIVFNGTVPIKLLTEKKITTNRALLLSKTQYLLPEKSKLEEVKSEGKDTNQESG